MAKRAKKKTAKKKNTSLAVVDYDGSKPLKSLMQEMVISNILQGMQNGEAYAAAGYKAKNPSNGYDQLRKNKDFLVRLAYRRTQLSKNLKVTEESQIKRFQDLSSGAEKAEQFSAAVQAEDRVCAILGLYERDNDQRRQALQINVVYYSHNGDGDNTTPQLQPA